MDTTALGDPARPVIRMAGTVRWFSPDRGFGFLVPDGGGEDVFVSWAALPGDGFRCLREGQRVTWEPSSDQHGPCARDIGVGT